MDNSDRMTERFIEAQDRLVLQAADLSLETIATMVEKQSIDVEPEFQRRERWSPEKQSALIESFLLNVPVPPVYLAEDDFGTYSVIDGKQRITTIHAFMRHDLQLTSVESFPEIRGLGFKNLPRQLRNALEVRPYLRVVTLLKQSDPSLKYEVFTRLNKGGEPLNPQEIRNVAFRGTLSNMINDLGRNKFLRQQLKIRNKKSPAFREMYDAEFVLRFLTLNASWRDFTGSLRRSMDNFMKENRSADETQITRYRNSFNRSIGTCRKLWGDHAFKRPGSGSSWRHQMLAGMYDAQMLAVAELTQAQIKSLGTQPGRVIQRTKRLFARDPDFEESVRRATNTPSRIVYRVETMRNALEEIA